MHLDEARLGNVLRPDKGRAFQLLTWSFAELPEWHRNTSVGWLPFAAVPSKLVLNLSKFMRFVLRLFFSLEGNNFRTLGIMLIDPRGRQYHMHASYKAMIADYKCHVEVGTLKGASGTTCCGKCVNVVNASHNIAWTAGRGYVRFQEPDKSKFVPHSQRTFSKMADMLAEARPTTSNADFKILEKRLGLKYDPEGLPWDLSLRHIHRLPDSMYLDWMHNFLASGGCAQYQVNEIVLEMNKHGVTLEKLDAFSKFVVFRKTHTKLSKTWFQDRIQPSTSANRHPHAKGFAGEMLMVIVIIDMFITLILEPEGIMKSHTVAFQHLVSVVRLLQMGDCLLQHVDDIEEALALWHKHFLELYPNCAKLKLHLSRHFPGDLRTNGVNLSCFRGERGIRVPKSIGSRCFKNYGSTLTSHLLNELLKGIDDGKAFFRDGLGHIVKYLPATSQPWARLRPVADVRSCNKARNKTGTLCKDDHVSWIANNGSQALGQILQFAAVPMHGGSESICAHVKLHTRVNPTKWLAHVHGAEHELVSLPLLVAQTCFRQDPFLILNVVL